MAEFIHYKVCYTCDRTYEIESKKNLNGCPYCGSKRSKRVGRMYEKEFRKIVSSYEGEDEELLKHRKTESKLLQNEYTQTDNMCE